MTDKEALGLFEKYNALLTGHFKLSSGLHSEKYLQCALVLQHPKPAEELGRAIAEHFKNDGVTVVAGPALGGVIIAHEVARALGVKCIFGEREEGVMKLRRGFSVDKDDKALVVEDVITTGGSLRELAAYISGCGAKVIGAASIIDRSEKAVDFGVKKASLVKLEVKTYNPDSCPMCGKGIPVHKPGSKK